MAYAAANILDFVRGFHDRAVQHQVDQAETNYLNDPQATIKTVMGISPSQGMALQNTYASQQKTAADAATATADANQKKVQLGVQYLRAMPKGADPTAYIAGIAPTLKQSNFDDDDIAGLKALATSGANLGSLDDKVYEANQAPKVLTPGAGIATGDSPIPTYTQPFEKKFIPQGSEKTGYSITTMDPNAAPGAPAAPAPAATEAPAPAMSIGGAGDPYQPLVKKEGGTNPDGSGRTSSKGAQGAGQIMPGTGPEAAAAAGLPWDPVRNLNDPNYSVALGRAYHAVQIGRFGGDMQKAAAAYNAGPGRVLRATTQGGKWLTALPAETQGYVKAAAPGFYGGSAPAPSGGGGATQQTIPAAAATSVRAATADEVRAAGYPEGTAAQIDSTGKFVNLKTPTAGKGGAGGKAPADPIGAYHNARRSLKELDDQLATISNDADVQGGWATGNYGNTMRHVGGTAAARLQGYVTTAHGMALNSAVQALKEAGNGNLGFRMTQAEAQAEGASLAGAIDKTDLSAGDYLHAIQGARQRIQQHIQDMDDGAVRQGLAARLPNGTLVMKGDKYKGHTYLGGDPSQPTSWKN